MTPARILKAALASLVVLIGLVAVASAGAAAWQGPGQISLAGVGSGNSPLVSTGAAGDAAAGWADTTNNRSVISRKRQGGGWSAPADIGAGGNVFVFTGTDGAGDVTAAFTNAGTTSVANWAATAAAPAVAPLAVPGAFVLDDLEVNAAGDLVFSGRERGRPRRGLPAGLRRRDHDCARSRASTPNNSRVAINAAGLALVVFRDGGTGLFVTGRTAGSTGGIPSRSRRTRCRTRAHGRGRRRRQHLGGVHLRQRRGRDRPAHLAEAGDRRLAGLRQPQLDHERLHRLAGADRGQLLRGGRARLEAGGRRGSDAHIEARYGCTHTGIWGSLETVNDAGADAPVAAIAADGRRVPPGSARRTPATRARRACVSPARAGCGATSTTSTRSTPPTSRSRRSPHRPSATSRSERPERRHEAARAVSVYDTAAPIIAPVAVPGRCSRAIR